VHVMHGDGDGEECTLTDTKRQARDTKCSCHDRQLGK